jgi:hypothetical protein
VPLIVSHMFVVLFRHHGRPDAAGGAGRLRGSADGQRKSDKIGSRRCKIALPASSCPSWRSIPGADAAAGRSPAKGFGSGPSVVYIVIKAVSPSCSWGIAAVGYLFGRLGVGAARGAFIAAAAGRGGPYHRRARLRAGEPWIGPAPLAGPPDRATGGMSLCLAAGALVVALGGDEITLRWRHSVQKTLWEEVWRDTPGGLQLDRGARQGSGAGMDPPDGAKLSTASGAGRPKLPALPEVVMRRSGATADWRVCIVPAPAGRWGPICRPRPTRSSSS